MSIITAVETTYRSYLPRLPYAFEAGGQVGRRMAVVWGVVWGDLGLGWIRAHFMPEMGSDGCRRSVFVGEQDRRDRPVPLGDDPDANALACLISTQKPWSFHQSRIVGIPVLFANLAPVPLPMSG